MTRTTLLALAVSALTACASPQVAAPDHVPFARALVSRASKAPIAARAPTREPAATVPASEPIEALVHVSAVRLQELRVIAAGAAESASQNPPTLSDRDDVAALVVLRSPAVRAAHDEFLAAQTASRQADDLADLVAVYRSFVTDADARVGPERSRVPAARITTSPGVDALSSELARESISIARERWRAATRDALVAAERLFADTVHLERTHALLGEQIALEERLLPVLRTRLETGRGSQAALLAFEARLSRLRSEHRVLADRRTTLAAGWDRFLDGSEHVALTPRLDAPDDLTSVDVDDAVAAALQSRPERIGVEHMARRAAIAVRLAETMTLPRMDVGSTRLERERAIEAGPDRGPVFPEPGRMIMPRPDFGIRVAQVDEMRARAAAAAARSDAVSRETRSRATAATVAREAVLTHLRTQESEVIPRAVSAFDAVRGSYEASRATYLELLDAARSLLDARARHVDLRRDLAHARAALLEAVSTLPERSPR